MRQIKLIIATLFLASPFAANADSIDLTGAELAGAANVSFPNGAGTLSGSSLIFNGTNFDVGFIIDMTALGFGPSQTTSGSVAVTDTRVASDSDLWFGLWDGSLLSAFTSFDGSRSQDQTTCGATSNGMTFSFCAGPQTAFITDQLIGAASTAVFDFDLVTGVLGFSIGGINAIGSLQSGFDTSNLSFIVGFGSPSENHQIDRVVIDGVASVPEPGTLALLGIGLFGMGLARRRKV